jgi:hypothetical protein
MSEKHDIDRVNAIVDATDASDESLGAREKRELYGGGRDVWVQRLDVRDGWTLNSRYPKY